MIEVREVTKSVHTGFWMKRTEILKSVSFRIERGSTHGLLGPNGAGKTSIIHLLVGIRKPDSGTLLIDGKPPSDHSVKLKVGYLPERPLFQEYLTGKQLLQYYAELSEIDAPRAEKMIANSLERVGIAHAADRLIKTYSKGMLQRLGIAQAILHKPELLILDEPMSGLDPVGRKEMRELILSFAKEGTTILFSSHVIPDVEALCDSITVIEHGKITADGKIDRILSQYASQIEIRFQAAHPLSGPFASAETTATGYRILLSPEKSVNDVVQKLISMEAQIQSIIPIRASLEEVFFK